MDLIRVARRVSEKAKPKRAKKPKKTSLQAQQPEIPEVSSNVLDPGVEFSFKIDLSLVVDFEGSAEVSEEKLRRKLKAEIFAAMKGAALMAANDFGLQASNISINPISISSAVNDQASVDERGGNV